MRVYLQGAVDAAVDLAADNVVDAALDTVDVGVAVDVVAVDVSDWANVQEIGRLSGVYNRSDALYPEGRFGYFECVDTSRGVAVDWVSEELVNPKCRR